MRGCDALLPSAARCGRLLASSSWLLLSLYSTLTRNNIRATANVDGYIILEVGIIEPAGLCYPKLVRVRPEGFEEEIQATDPGIESFRNICAHVLAASLDSSSPVPPGTFVIRGVKRIDHVVLDVIEGVRAISLHVLLEMACIVVQ